MIEYGSRSLIQSTRRLVSRFAESTVRQMDLFVIVIPLICSNSNSIERRNHLRVKGFFRNTDTCLSGTYVALKCSTEDALMRISVRNLCSVRTRTTKWL